MPKLVKLTGDCGAYYFLFHLFGVVILLPWIVRSSTWGPVVDGDGQSRVWWYEPQTSWALNKGLT